MKHTSNSMGRDSSLDSERESSRRGVLGVPTKPAPWLTKLTGDSITGLLSKTLAFSSCPFALFLACNTATLFFPRSVQQHFPAAEAEPAGLEQRSWARVPGLRYLFPELRDCLLPLTLFVFSFGDTFPILSFPTLNPAWKIKKRKLKNKDQEEEDEERKRKVGTWWWWWGGRWK